MKTKLDGGYYAIKGFNFQYDFSIYTILNEQNENLQIEIEQSEDLSTINAIIQVKYKERTTYAPSVIKKPVYQLLEIYKTDKRQPILYAHFLEKEPGINPVTLEELNVILNDKKNEFTDALKLEFIKHFRIHFTEKFQVQYENTISKICEVFRCDEDEAEIYYCSIYKYVERKVLENPPEKKELRLCTKNELINLIDKNNELIFYSQFSNYKGKEKYYNLIKNKYFSTFNLPIYARIFILSVTDTIENDILDFILKIKNKFYKTKTLQGITTIQSPAPFVLINGISPESLKSIKTQLQSLNINFRDGHAFLNADFNLSHLIEPSTSQNNIQLRFINDIKDLSDVCTNIQSTKKIYHFYISSDYKTDVLVDAININVESISDINQYIL